MNITVFALLNAYRDAREEMSNMARLGSEEPDLLYQQFMDNLTKTGPQLSGNAKNELLLKIITKSMQTVRDTREKWTKADPEVGWLGENRCPPLCVLVQTTPRLICDCSSISDNCKNGLDFTDLTQSEYLQIIENCGIQINQSDIEEEIEKQTDIIDGVTKVAVSFPHECSTFCPIGWTRHKDGCSYDDTSSSGDCPENIDFRYLTDDALNLLKHFCPINKLFNHKSEFICEFDESVCAHGYDMTEDRFCVKGEGSGLCIRYALDDVLPGEYKDFCKLRFDLQRRSFTEPMVCPLDQISFGDLCPEKFIIRQSVCEHSIDKEVILNSPYSEDLRVIQMATNPSRYAWPCRADAAVLKKGTEEFVTASQLETGVDL